MAYIKTYVLVIAQHSRDGHTTPLKIMLDDKLYHIDDVTDMQHNYTSQSVRELCVRYTIRVKGKQTYLYREKQAPYKWFVGQHTDNNGAHNYRSMFEPKADGHA